MIWNYYNPIIINRRFLKPRIYVIIDAKLQNKLREIYKYYGYELEKL